MEAAGKKEQRHGGKVEMVVVSVSMVVMVSGGGREVKSKSAKSNKQEKQNKLTN
jgi:hypothetical protein